MLKTSSRRSLFNTERTKTSLAPLALLSATLVAASCDPTDVDSHEKVDEQGVQNITSNPNSGFCGDFRQLKDSFDKLSDQSRCESLQRDYLKNPNQYIRHSDKDTCCECFFPGSICPAGQVLKSLTRCQMMNDDYREKIEDAAQNGVRSMFCPEPQLRELETCCAPAPQKKDYNERLVECNAEISAVLPLLDPAKTEAFMEAHRAESQNATEAPDTGYHDLEAVSLSLSLSRSILGSAAMEQFLTDKSLEKTLVECAVLAQALPAGLEEFSKQGDQEKQLVDVLLADHELMKQILIAGGPKAARYGPAMQIYDSIQKASALASSGLFQRLAVATSLELAAPELCNNYEQIDPVKRYLFYEQSFMDGELIPQFADMTTWEYRHVINSWSSEEDLSWLREMLRNYRPDFITHASDEDRFVGIQSLDSAIPQKPVEYDEKLPYTRNQQVLAKGGQCGAKAVFARSLMRSFGVPVWGITMRGHAAIGYWSPSGWRDNLLGSWEDGFWLNDSVDIIARIHLLETKARSHFGEYEKASRLEWVGEVLGEEDIDLMLAGHGDLWSALALNKKRAIAQDDYVTPPETPELDEPEVTAADTQIATDKGGAITIPAVACTKPGRPEYGCSRLSLYGHKTKIIENAKGEKLLHYHRLSSVEPFSYFVDVPRDGKYELVARVVTVNMHQSFILTVNGADSPTQVKLPYTVGMWGTSAPVVVSLAQGQNELTFSRKDPYPEGSYGWYCNTHNDPDCGGITIQYFKLIPAQ